MENSFKKIKTFVILFTTFYFLFSILPVLAPTAATAEDKLPSAITVINQTTGQSEPATINQIIANMAKLTLGLVGVLALVMFVIGGITWMTSAGNAEQVKKGKGILIWSTIGLVTCFLAYSLVTFVITKFIGVAGK